MPDYMSTSSILDITLHHFSDASEEGYGRQCSYIRFEDVERRIHCSLVLGKSRVSTKKLVSMPRLELTTAVLSTKVANQLRKELSLAISKEYFWTDSQIVLACIKNEAKKYKIFVANRVQFIQEHTDANQWRYVNTSNNPADLASMGFDMNHKKAKVWYRGPDYLWKKESDWSFSKPEATYDDIDEVKKIHVNAITAINMTNRFKRIGCYIKLKGHRMGDYL